MKENIIQLQDYAQDLGTKHSWQTDEVMDLINLPFNDLIFKAAEIHRQHHNANKIQISTLFSIKTCSCPKNCKYCPQSAHYDTGLEPVFMLKSVLICTLLAL